MFFSFCCILMFKTFVYYTRRFFCVKDSFHVDSLEGCVLYLCYIDKFPRESYNLGRILLT